MNTRHYLVISGIVGGVIGSLLTALLVSPVTAQRDKFGEIECTNLRVVDGGGVSVWGKDGKLKVVLGFDALGGRVNVNDGDGKPSVSLGVIGDGGSVDVYSGDGVHRAWLGVDARGEGLSVSIAKMGCYLVYYRRCRSVSMKTAGMSMS